MLDLYMDLKKDKMFNDYILAGGTALALQLGHRTSTDLDLFTTHEQSNREILNKINEKYGQYFINSLQPSFLELFIKNIKVDVGQYKAKVLEIPKTIDGITLFGKKDLVAMKLNATLTRGKGRDFIDIAYLLNTYSLKEMFEIYKKKYETKNIDSLKISLKRCKAIPKDEWLIDIKMLKNDVDILKIPYLIDKELNKLEKGFNKYFFKKLII
ncbi:MAG: nucleotidyl transferase AbiEii/AbiGii toxin family protein, partial [Treponema sp.]|jgi:predicted nucleotidyltransferase component of viral defense system|nr:nucleotidyl transferase AbiEii/AbiGii toxin family protein [Treponema sp.]